MGRLGAYYLLYLDRVVISSHTRYNILSASQMMGPGEAFRGEIDGDQLRIIAATLNVGQIVCSQLAITSVVFGSSMLNVSYMVSIFQSHEITFAASLNALTPSSSFWNWRFLTHYEHISCERSPRRCQYWSSWHSTWTRWRRESLGMMILSRFAQIEDRGRNLGSSKRISQITLHHFQ